jgi:hypothetical protein
MIVRLYLSGGRHGWYVSAEQVAAPDELRSPVSVTFDSFRPEFGWAMSRSALCSLVNLSVVVTFWVGSSWLVSRAIGGPAWWRWALIAPTCLVASGYFVQYIISPIVNRFVMRACR